MADFTTRDKVALLKDFLNVVGTETEGVEVKVTRDADNGMRFYSDPEVVIEVKNATLAQLDAGTPVYVSGTAASGKPEVSPAQANSATTMPAIGLIQDDIASGDEGFVVAGGLVVGLDTDTPAWDDGTALYVSPTVAGGLTDTRPTGTTELVQKVALVTRRHATVGSVIVMGAGRTNDIPNDLVTLTGVPRGDSDLGTFTGTTIADNETIKGALQDLETAVESAGGGGDPNAEIRQYAGFDYVVLDAADSSSAAGDIPLVLTPKGVGSVMLTMPDGTDSLTGTGGGNARGTRSVDLTTFRRRNFDVCSGDLNFMAGQSSRIAGGAANVVVGYRAQSEYPTAGYNVVIGSSASAGNFQYGTLSTVIGRGHYTTYADTTTIGTNNGNYHSGGPLGFNRPHSQIIVGNSCRPHQPASITINNGRWESGSNLNNSLPSRVVLRRMTTDATAAELRCQMYAGFTPGVQTQDNSINTHDMNLLALSDTGDWAQWQRRFVTKRNSGAATTTLVSTTTVGTDSGSNSGSAPAGWSFATAIDPNGVFGQAGMLITEVTGAASTNIRWIATIDTLECEYS